MKALVFHKPGKVSVDNVPDPQIQKPDDIILRVTAGGVVTVVGVYGMPYDNFPLGQIFDKGITMRFGQAPAQHYIDELLTWVEQRKIRLDDIITHRLPLEEAAHGYDIFCKKKDNCVKVVLKP